MYTKSRLQRNREHVIESQANRARLAEHCLQSQCQQQVDEKQKKKKLSILKHHILTLYLCVYKYVCMYECIKHSTYKKELILK